MKPSDLIYTLSLLALPLTTTAMPLSSSSSAENASKITPAQIEAIAPMSKSCSTADRPDECATSKVAAPAISKSFATYKVTSKAEQAAVIGLMAFESGQFRYSRNHHPGVPGQGSMSTSLSSSVLLCRVICDRVWANMMVV